MTKQISVFFFAFLVLHLTAFAQDDNELPEVFRANFNKMFAAADIKSYYTADQRHCVLFEDTEKVIKVAKYDESGKWVETITALNLGMLPEKIHHYLAEDHHEMDVFRDMLKVESATEELRYIIIRHIGQPKAYTFNSKEEFMKEENIDEIDSEILKELDEYFNKVDGEHKHGEDDHTHEDHSSHDH